jgi:hypothetical protein
MKGGAGARPIVHTFLSKWSQAAFLNFCLLTQHPTPYYDDSYGVNTANMGPRQRAPRNSTRRLKSSSRHRRALGAHLAWRINGRLMTSSADFLP